MVQSLHKVEREKIFKLFLTSSTLKFSEIEESMQLRSNMVAYHLQQMLQENLIEKNGHSYSLTHAAERLLPYYSRKAIGSPLPVVLVALLHKQNILLLKRNIRPYQNYWGLIGGKILFGESIAQATIRLVEEKTSLAASFVAVHAVMQEHVVAQGKTKHSFLPFFTKAITHDTTYKETAYGALQWFTRKALQDHVFQKKMIPSDLWLIENRLKKSMHVDQFVMQEDGA